MATDLSADIGIGVSVVLLFFGIVGNLTLLRDLTGYQLGTGAALMTGALILVGNLVFRLYRRATGAEQQLASLRSEPDSAEVTRMFLRLYDRGARVLEYFDEVVERLPVTIPEGRDAYREWIIDCAAAIERFRPAHALRFRQAQLVSREAGGILIVTEVDGSKRHVSMGEVTYYRGLVEAARRVLADIVNDG